GSNVRTVLTKKQAMTNMQQFARGSLLNDLPAPMSQPADLALEQAAEEEEFSQSALERIAVEHVSRHISWKCKTAKAELRAAGFDPADSKQREIYITAYFAEKRRALSKI